MVEGGKGIECDEVWFGGCGSRREVTRGGIIFDFEGDRLDDVE